jgi:hypothetical protein
VLLYPEHLFTLHQVFRSLEVFLYSLYRLVEFHICFRRSFRSSSLSYGSQKVCPFGFALAQVNSTKPAYLKIYDANDPAISEVARAAPAAAPGGYEPPPTGYGPLPVTKTVTITVSATITSVIKHCTSASTITATSYNLCCSSSSIISTSPGSPITSSSRSISVPPTTSGGTTSSSSTSRSSSSSPSISAPSSSATPSTSPTTPITISSSSSSSS